MYSPCTQWVNRGLPPVTPELIKSAWRKAGIWPQDPGKFTDKDFTPSKLMSYAASLPPEYPELADILEMLENHGSEGSE